jgi:hypothetical protein
MTPKPLQYSKWLVPARVLQLRFKIRGAKEVLVQLQPKSGDRLSVRPHLHTLHSLGKFLWVKRRISTLQFTDEAIFLEKLYGRN